jgi:hypothetical protein
MTQDPETPPEPPATTLLGLALILSVVAGACELAGAPAQIGVLVFAVGFVMTRAAARLNAPPLLLRGAVWFGLAAVAFAGPRAAVTVWVGLELLNVLASPWSYLCLALWFIARAVYVLAKILVWTLMTLWRSVFIVSAWFAIGVEVALVWRGAGDDASVSLDRLRQPGSSAASRRCGTSRGTRPARSSSPCASRGGVDRARAGDSPERRRRPFVAPGMIRLGLRCSDLGRTAGLRRPRGRRTRHWSASAHCYGLRLLRFLARARSSSSRVCIEGWAGACGSFFSMSRSRSGSSDCSGTI